MTTNNHPNAETTRTEVNINLEAGRRAFLKTAGIGAVGLAIAAGTGRAALAESTITDADILNFALNLEYLEAEFYLRAAFGRGLDDRDTMGRGDRGSVTGGRKVNFDTKDVRLYAREIANDEEAHVKFLRSQLGDAAVARPQINLKRSFSQAARAAGLIGVGGEFDAYASDTNFLLAAFIFEDVGVTAFKGSARFIRNPDTLEALAGILAVEAYHAGLIRTLLYGRNQQLSARAISDLRDSADGPSNIDEGIGNENRANIVPADDNGLAFSRRPGQVINIVTLGGGERGGFFPEGLNGNINGTQLG